MRLINIEDVSLLKTVSCGGLSAKALWKRIKEQPIVDAVEVVRCKDCKYWHNNTELCDLWSVPNVAQHTYPNGYCFRAQRREL